MQEAIGNYSDYLNIINSIEHPKGSTVLFRGQDAKYPLLPGIARKNCLDDTTSKEKRILNEFKRRVEFYLRKNFKTDWEWLVFAQHYGLKTRLLDWTSNPLVALWFACINTDNRSNGYVYIYEADKTHWVTKDDNPFNYSKTLIYRPALNNERVIAQAGWFTIHKYSTNSGKFVELNSNPEINNDIYEIVIPFGLKRKMLQSLHRYGVSYQSLFPGIEGVCKQFNTQYLL